MRFTLFVYNADGSRYAMYTLDSLAGINDMLKDFPGLDCRVDCYDGVSPGVAEHLVFPVGDNEDDRQIAIDFSKV